MPVCDSCLRTGERAVRVLVHDYVDLEQMLPPTLARPWDDAPGGTGEPPAPIRTGIEALQRTIWRVSTVWAEILADRLRLSAPPWTVGPVRDGYAVRWALDILAPRVVDLARHPAVALTDYPLVDGVGDVDVTGAEALLHLSRCHAMVRGLLGIGQRTTRVPGRCGCGGDGNWLFRDDPRYPGDPQHVYCGACSRQWTDAEYTRYVGLMLAHPHLAEVAPEDDRGRGTARQPALAGAR